MWVSVFGDNFVEIWYFTGQNVLFWGGSIKRPDLPTAYRYRPESFSVDSNMIGRSAVTRSDQLDATIEYEILQHFWPASEPCRATITVWTQLCLPLPSLIATLNMKAEHAQLKTVLCQIWGLRWNLVLYGPKCPILRQTARFPTAYRYRTESFSVDNMIGRSAVTLALFFKGKFYNIFDLHRSWTGNINHMRLYVSCAVNMKAWTESFSVDSNRIGRSTCDVTSSDLMRVSHSWTPQLNIAKF